MHIGLGRHFDVTVETQLIVVDGGTRWTGEPLTADAAGALLPLNSRAVTFVKVDPDGTLNLGLGEATVIRGMAGARTARHAHRVLARRRVRSCLEAPG
jgi:hypothetical protein